MKRAARHLAVLMAALLLAACEGEPPPPPPPAVPDVPAAPPTPTPSPTPRTYENPDPVDLGDGVIYRLYREGDGPPLEAGSLGEFELRIDGPEAVRWSGRFSFAVGSGQAFPGLDRGVRGMRRGELRTIEMPGALGPESTLSGSVRVEAELLKIEESKQGDRADGGK